MANLERVFVVMSTVGPDFNPRLLDRFLVGVEHQELDGIIVLNKCDLAADSDWEAALRPYHAADYATLLTSAESGMGVEDLRAAMAGRVSLFLGPSGAGKSSLLRRLQPGLEIATLSISESTGKGRHATSYTELHELDSGGWVADSPGVREFGLWGMVELELADCFPEFRDHLDGCRYPNCSHSHEPACGLRVAAEGGTVDAGRFESYQRILESIRQGKLGF